MNTYNLIELREELGLTQEKIANLIGVKENTYSQYETGKAIIPLKRLNIISNKYDVSLDYLVGISRTNHSNFKHVDIDNQKIGNIFRKLRLENDLTLEYIAKKLNLGISTISDYEKNKITITIPILIEYSELFGKSIDFLCGKSTK